MQEYERDKKIDKLAWDVDSLKKENAQQNKDVVQHEGRIRKLESFKDSTVEKLITIFNAIDDIKEESRWMKRLLTSSLVSGIVTAIISLVVWLIQKT